ncbi:DUF480 domain-containing protein [Marinobacteraceae bacterium S3BR75-40.1]
MKHDLTFYECRVLGVLLEKEVTTPEQYPLSLNALTNACNQKSNRHPVVQIEERTVSQTLDALQARHLVSRVSGSRVEKYRHRFCNTEFSDLQFSVQQVAVIAELLLRGPQTPGELRSRASRMADFKDVSEVETVLLSLQDLSTPLVRRLPKEPGKRDARFMHLLSGEPDIVEEGVEEDPAFLKAENARLQNEVARLKEEVSSLRQKLRDAGIPVV